MRLLVTTFLVFISLIASAKPVLNIYNWADYMPVSVINQFEEETGIQINYMEFDSNETMYARLKANPNLGYDLIFPSSYYVLRMRREKMLLPLDKNQLKNFSNLKKQLLNQNFDPGNEYSVPYLWGTMGIVVNKQFLNPHQFTGWVDFWKPALKNHLLLFDDMREVFSLALFRLGYSINETNPKHIYQAYQLLKSLWPNIKLFSIEAEQSIYIDEDAYIGVGLNGEIFNAITENRHLVYIYPKEGFEIWTDCMAIPLNAPHPKEALQFIDFILRPKIAAQIAMATGFSSANQAAVPLLPQAMRDSTIINPSAETLKRSEFLKDLGDTNSLYEKYWNKLKIGE